MLDPSFWLMTLSLWMKANNPQNLSEFCRAEVLYDVLLPWIVEKDPLKGNVVSGNIHSNNKKRCLAELIHSTDIIRTDSDPNYQNFSTTQRSTSGAVKSLMTAMQYILFSYGVSCETIKQIKFVIKYEFFLKGAEDLQLLAKKQLSLYIPTSGRIPCDNNDGDNLSPNSKSLLSLTEKSNDIVSSASALASSRSPSHSSGLRPLPKNLISLEAAVTNMKCNAGIDPKFTSLTIHHFFNAMDNPAVDFVKSAKNVIAPSSLFCNQGKVVVVYFGASWCNPCKTISSLVVNMYEHLQKRLPDIFSKVEFILVPLDKTREAAEEYGSKFPFHRVNFPPNNNIMKTFDISKIPTMLIFGSDGALMTSEGVKALMADPEATQFPVSPWNGAFPLTSTDLAMWKYSQQVLSHHALKKHDNNLFSDSHLRRIYTVMDAVQKVVEAMPYVDDDGEEVFPSSAVPFETETYSLNTGGDADEKCEETNLTTTSPFCEIPEESTQFMNSAMINHVRTDRYAGTSFNSRVPHMGDLSLFTVPTSMLELVKLLARSKEHVQKLWDMACHSGTSSRVAVQMQIIEFIVWLFTSVIPVPRPNDTDIASVVAKAVTPEEKAIASSFTRTNDRVYHSVTSTLYYEAFPTSQPAAGPQSRITNDTQISICHAIYFMMLSYATAWQAVESPTRSYDSERALVCMTMLTVYDVLCRNENGSSEGQMLASLMNHYNGGFFLSTTICKGMVSFSDTSSKFELTKPGNLAIRDAVIMQINFQKTKYKNELFDLRVPEKIEIRKYSHTVAFLRKFVENCGYRLDGREDEENAAEAQQQLGGQAGQELANVMRDRMGRSRGTGGMQIGGNEMEKLMFWFCDPKSLLATEHHEFGMVRDMVLLTKFMCTMEIRSSQLLRKKKEMDAFATWRLSFEEDTPGKQMSAGWRTNPKPPVWECLMVRGRDMDIADLVVKGFGDREISQYGEGLVLQSPIDASKHLNIDSPMEEDVLHATSLPTFANVLSQEEAEAFWSALTVPYMRIPLILDFFSTQDRHTYLFSPAIQTALRAALFESGSYIPLPTSETHFDSQFEIPLRLNANQRREAELQKMMLQGAKGDTTSLLGTTYGLLLNGVIVQSPISHMSTTSYIEKL